MKIINMKVFTILIITMMIFSIINGISCADQEDFMEIKDPPVIIMPPPDAEYCSSRITFSWTHVSNADSYDIIVNDELWVNIENEKVSEEGTLYFEYIPLEERDIATDKDLEFLKKFKKLLVYDPEPIKWYVVARNEFQKMPSNVQSFRIKDCVPPSITILDPVDNQEVYDSITISGVAEDNISIETMYVSVDGGEKIPLEGFGAFEYELSTNDLSVGPHTVTVYAYDGEGGEGLMTIIIYVKIETPKPQKVGVQLIPEGGGELPDWYGTTTISDKAYVCAQPYPNFTWSKCDGATQYRFQLSTTSDFSDIIHDKKGIKIDEYDEYVSYKYPTFLVSGDYYWRIVGMNDHPTDGSGEWSAVYFFRQVVFDPPELISPAHEFVSHNSHEEFSWKEMSEAYAYQIQIARQPLGPNGEFPEGSVVVDYIISTNKFAPTEGLQQGRHYWRIKALTDRCDSLWTDLRILNVSVIEIPRIIAPTCGVVECSPPAFQWDSVTGALGYNYQLSTDSDFVTIVSNGFTSNTSFTPVPNPLPRGTYFFRVCSSDGLYFTAFSASCSFVQAGIDNPPGLVSPPDGGKVCTGSPLLSWDTTAVGASEYKLEVATDSNFSGIVYTTSGITSTSFTIGTSLPNNTYYWRVEAKDPLCTPKVSNWRMMEIWEVDPGPVLLTPANNSPVCDIRPTFTWQSMVGATKYRIQINTKNDFTGTVIADVTDIVGTTYTIPATSPELINGDYYWRVQGINDYCNNAFGTPFHFEKIGLSVDVVLQSPAVNADTCDPTPQFDWDIIGPIYTYILQIDTDTNFDGNPVPDIIIPASTSTYTLTGVGAEKLPYGQWYWRVLAKNGSCLSPGNNHRIVNIRDIAIQPVLTNDDPCKETPELKWTAVTGAQHYKIEVSLDDFATTIFTQDPIDAPDTSFTLPSLDGAPFVGNNTYYWRIQAYNDYGCLGNYEKTSFTKVGSNDPVTLNTPNDNSFICNNTNINLSWNAIPYADTYEIYVATSTNFATDSIAGYAPKTGIMGTTHTIAGPLPAGEYHWKVNGIDSPGATCTRIDGDIFKFSIIETPTISGPADGSTQCSTAINLSWSNVPTADNYHIEVATNAGFTENNITIDTTGTSTTFNIGIAGNRTYYWHVRAEHTSCPIAGQYTPTQTFIKIGVDDGVTLNTPDDVQYICNDDTPTLTWNTVPNANEYKLYISKNNLFTDLIAGYTPKTGLVGTSHEVVGALTTGEYWWKVEGVDTSHPSAPSCPAATGGEEWQFNIVRPPTNLTNPANGYEECSTSITLQWDNVSTANSYHIQITTHGSNNYPVGTIDEDDVGTNSYTYTIAKGNTRYYWRVRADQTGAKGCNDGIYSAEGYFDKVGANAGVLLSLPIDETYFCNTTTPNLSWNSVPNADEYKVYVATSTDFTTDTIATYPKTEAGLSHTVTATLTDQTYWWKVEGIDTAKPDCPAVLGDVWKFHIVPKPTLQSPADTQKVCNLFTEPLTLQWNPVNTADSYYVEISTDGVIGGGGGFSNVHQNFTTSNTNGTFNINDGNKVYYWHVRADRTSECNDGDFSNVWTFEKVGVDSTITLTNPNNNSFFCDDTTIDLSWTGNAEADNYEIYISRADDINGVTGSCPNCIAGYNPSTVGASPHTTSSLTSGEYWWKVYGVDSDGTTCTRREITARKFTVVTTPSPLDTATSASDGEKFCKINGTTDKVYLEWSPVPTADEYYVQISTNADLVTLPVYSYTVSSPTTTLEIITSTNGNDTYYWHVKANGASCTSTTFSSTWSFQKVGVDDPITDFLMTSPTDNSYICATQTPELKWNTVNYADTHEIYLTKGGTNVTGYPQTGIVGTTHTIVTSLTAGEYKWKVYGVDNDGTTCTRIEGYERTFTIVDPPTLNSPVDNTLFCNLPIAPITLKWNSIPTADEYRVEVSEFSDFSGTPTAWLVTATGGATEQTTFSIPSTNGIYYWHVRSINSFCSGLGDYSDTWKFEIAGIDEKIVLNSPADLSDICATQTPELVWTNNPDADRYEVHLATTNVFNAGDYVTGYPKINGTAVASSPHTVETTLAAGTYYWKIIGIDDDKADCPKATPDIFSFSILPKVTLDSPNDGDKFCNLDVGFPVPLVWNTITTADEYYVEVSTSNSVDGTGKFNAGTIHTFTVAAPDTTLNFTNNEGNVTYYWHVRADATGCADGDFSDIRSFIKEGIDTKVTITSPTDGTYLCFKSNRPTFEWNVHPQANTYTIEIDDDPAFNSIDYTKSGIASATTDFTIDVDLTGGKQYYWRVLPIDSTGCIPPNPMEWTFYLVGTPQLVNPADTFTPPVCATSTQLRWTPVTWADHYTLQVDDEPTFAAPRIIDSNYTSATILYNLDTTVNKKYYWRVRAESTNCGVDQADWTTIPVWKFEKSGVDFGINTISPLNNECDSTPLLRWTHDPDAEYYTIHLWGGPIAVNLMYNNLTDTQYNIVGAEAQYELPVDLPYGVNYYWEVKGRDSSTCADGPFGPSKIFHIRKITGKPTPISPSPGDWRCNSPVSFSWSSVTNANRYDIEADDDPGFGSIDFSSYNVGGTSANLTLSTGTWYWRTRAKYYWSATGMCNGPWQDTGIRNVVLTDLPKPTNLQPGAAPDICISNPPLDWDNVPGATYYHFEVATSSDFIATPPFYTDWSVPASNKTYSFPVGKYFWRVRGANPTCTNTGQWEIQEINISYVNNLPKPYNNPCIPGMSWNSYPLENQIICTDTVTLTWAAASGGHANTYRLQVTTSNNFTAGPFIHNGLVTGTSHILNGLDAVNNTVYYWRVRGENPVNGCHSPNYGAVRKFRAIDIGSISLNNLAAGNHCPEQIAGGNRRYDFDWTAPVPSGANRYEMQVAHLNTGNIIWSDNDINTNSRNNVPLNYTNADYFWRVRPKWISCSGTGDYVCYGPYTNWRSFHIMYKPEIDVNSPLGNSYWCDRDHYGSDDPPNPPTNWLAGSGQWDGNNPKLTLGWTAEDPLTDRFKIDITKDGSAWHTTYVAGPCGGGCTYQTPTLDDGSDYIWRVLPSHTAYGDGKSGSNCTGPWVGSDFVFDTMTTRVPNQTTPANNAIVCDTNSLTFNWGTTDHTTRYHFLLFKGATTYREIPIFGAGHDYTITTPSIITGGSVNVTINTSWTGEAKWKIQSYNPGPDGSLSCHSSWSPDRIVKFSFVSGTYFAVPTNNITLGGTSTTLKWNSTPAGAATKFRVEYATNDTFSADLVVEPAVPTNELAISGLNAGTTYYWRVKGYNNDCPAGSDWAKHITVYYRIFHTP